MTGTMMTNPSIRIQQQLLDKISLVRLMGITVAGIDDNSLTLAAPFDQNINDKGTGFGGSIFSIAAVTGWALIMHQAWQEQLQLETVISTGEISYLKSITGDFCARCRIQESEVWQNFIEQIKKKSRAKLPLKINILQDGEIKAVLNAVYHARCIK